MTDQTIRLRAGDCIEVLRAMQENSVGAVITDPPYGL
jgi:DNA modification methylase